MKDRILKLMDYYKLTSSQFANEIGIQRSVISHILSGRNKPSLDFIIKVKTRFPEINSDWLLLGEGSMVVVSGTGEIEKKNMKKTTKTDLFSDVIEGTKSTKTSIEEQKKSSVKDKTEEISLEKIIFFYRNGKFKIFLPE
jgi:plasmid maintenance system antidote protein VapI